MRHLKVHIDKIEDDSEWITGNIGDGAYEFYSKVEDKKSNNGIEKGRVIKLVIRKGEVKEKTKEDEFWKDVVANFDRSWLIKPAGSEAIEVFYSILDELEKLPTYKERIYEGSQIKKFISKTKTILSTEIK